MAASMSTPAFVHYPSLPPASKTLSSSTSAFSSYSSPYRVSTSSPTSSATVPSRHQSLPPKPSPTRRRLSQPPSARTTTTESPLTLTPPKSVFILNSPDPTTAVRAARRSVQFAPGSYTVRPHPATGIDTSDAPPVPAFPPSSFGPPRPSRNMRVPRMRTVSTLGLPNAIGSSSSPASTLSSACSEDDEPVTPSTTLPPGAAPATNLWGNGKSELKGLGISNIDTAVPHLQPSRSSTSSPSSACTSSDEGSLAGDSLYTASSSSAPCTPTRLQFVSDSFNSLSNPSTLDELRSLKAAASELDMEAKRLRRLRGREPPVSPRVLPRKAVPTVTDADLVAAPSPRRRAAVRHSLIIPTPQPGAEGGYTLAGPEMTKPVDHPYMLGAAASRRPFYAQGKASMSVIEFSPRKDSQAAGVPVGASAIFRNRHASSAVPARRLEKTDDVSPVTAKPKAKSVKGPSDMPSMPFTISSPIAKETAIPPSISPITEASPDLNAANSFSPPSQMPQRTLAGKPSSSFLGKHKKLSRFLGKA